LLPHIRQQGVARQNGTPDQYFDDVDHVQ